MSTILDNQIRKTASTLYELLLLKEAEETYPYERFLTSRGLAMTTGGLIGGTLGLIPGLAARSPAGAALGALIGGGGGAGLAGLGNWVNRMLYARALKGRIRNKKGLYKAEQIF